MQTEIIKHDWSPIMVGPTSFFFGLWIPQNSESIKNQGDFMYGIGKGSGFLDVERICRILNRRMTCSQCRMQFTTHDLLYGLIVYHTQREYVVSTSTLISESNSYRRTVIRILQEWLVVTLIFQQSQILFYLYTVFTIVEESFPRCL